MTGQLISLPAVGTTGHANEAHTEHGADAQPRAYLALPPSGRGPGLIVLQEWWGLVDHIKDVADRFAAEGFVTLAPDLYDGTTTDSPDEAGRRMMALNIEHSSARVAHASTFLQAHAATQPSRIGVLGFCMGGQLALHAACEHPTKFHAVVDFYGIHPAVNLDASQLNAPVLAHFGNHDDFVPRSEAESLVQKLKEAGKHVEAHFYEAGHAFFNDSRPEAHHRASSELAWTRTLTFLRATLQGA